MINVLITAGGTCENIDSVRSISNHATGRLGSMIADTFAKSNSQITYVCGEASVVPTFANAEIVRIRSVNDLSEAMESLLNRTPFHCVIHSMAVSDFTPHSILTVDKMVEAIAQALQADDFSLNEITDRIRNAIYQSEKPLTQKKISSKSSDVALLLKQTPKIISRIKTIQPGTLLVGFKLLSNVPETDLVQAGQDLLAKNSCDLVLANDLVNIKNNMHKAILMDKNGILQSADSKQEIAEMIFECVTERIGIK